MKWDKLFNITHSTAVDTFGKKTSKTCDLFGTKEDVMMPVIEYKRSAHLKYVNLPSSKNFLELDEHARKKIQQATRKCANEFWVELSQTIQLATNTGNIHGVYDGVKKAIGPA